MQLGAISKISARAANFVDRKTDKLCRKLNSNHRIWGITDFISRHPLAIGLVIMGFGEFFFRVLHLKTGIHFGYFQNNLGDTANGIIGSSAFFSWDKPRLPHYFAVGVIYTGMEFLSLNDTFVNTLKNIGIRIGVTFDPLDIAAFFAGSFTL